MLFPSSDICSTPSKTSRKGVPVTSRIVAPIRLCQYCFGRHQRLAAHQRAEFTQLPERQTGERFRDAVEQRIGRRRAFDGTFRGRDYLDGREIPNTGSVILAVTPALSWRLNDRMAVEGAVNLPVYYDVRSTQVVPVNGTDAQQSEVLEQMLMRQCGLRHFSEAAAQLLDVLAHG